MPALQCKDGTVDPYVVLRLEDPASVKPEEQRSSSMTNEANPHYNTKFDFVMISATSTLRIYVYDKKSTLQNVMAQPVKMIAGNITGEGAACTRRDSGKPGERSGVGTVSTGAGNQAP